MHYDKDGRCRYKTPESLSCGTQEETEAETERGHRNIDIGTSEREGGGKGWIAKDRKGGRQLETLRRRVEINGGNGATEMRNNGDENGRDAEQWRKQHQRRGRDVGQQGW